MADLAYLEHLLNHLVDLVLILLAHLLAFLIQKNFIFHHPQIPDVRVGQVGGVLEVAAAAGGHVLIPKEDLLSGSAAQSHVYRRLDVFSGLGHEVFIRYHCCLKPGLKNQKNSKNSKI